MKRGSIVVKDGDEVGAGQKLGEVGHSGYVEFPHLHITVRSGEHVIDPFTGLSPQAGCGRPGTSLWSKRAALEYAPVSLYAAGFADREPDFAELRRDASSPERLPVGAAVLTFWVAMFGAADGDRIRLEIRDPQGALLSEREIVQGRDRARQFYFVGRRNRDGRLVRGVYSGTVELVRTLADGSPLQRSLSRNVLID